MNYNLNTDEWPRELLDDLNHLEGVISVLRSERDSNAVEINNKIQKRLLISQVYNSNAIEGNALKLNQTERILESAFSNASYSSKSKDEVDVISLGHASNFLQELISAKADLDERAIKDLHALTISKEHHPGINSGAYRKEDVQIGNSDHTPPSFLDLEEHMGKMFQWKRKNSHTYDSPLVVGAVLHHWFTWIHPFSDGNGRTARLFLNFYLSQLDYPQIIIRVEDRDRYYDSLASADNGNIIPLVELLADRLRSTIDIIEEEVNNYKRSLVLKSELDQIKQAEYQKLVNKKKIEYEIWKSNLNVFQERFKSVLASFNDALPNHSFQYREFDIISFDKYIALLEEDKITNDWFITISIYDNFSKRKIFLIFKFKYHSFKKVKNIFNNKVKLKDGTSVLLTINKKDNDTGHTLPLFDDNDISLINIGSFKDQLIFGVRTYTSEVLNTYSLSHSKNDNYNQIMKTHKIIINDDTASVGRYRILSVSGNSEDVISDFMKEVLRKYFDLSI